MTRFDRALRNLEHREQAVTQLLRSHPFSRERALAIGRIALAHARLVRDLEGHLVAVAMRLRFPQRFKR